MHETPVRMTICFVFDQNRVLLGMKKKGLGEGWWNGFGGKVEAGETIEDAARREVQEEAGILVQEVAQVGQLSFSFADKPLTIDAHIFRADQYTGEPSETEEMRPEWFEISRIPYDCMWPADALWIPFVVEGKRFTGRIRFGEGTSVLEHEFQFT